MNLNKVFVLGNVTRDPEIRALPSGQQVTSFGIATNRFYSVNGEKKQDVEFHNIVCFGKLADIASQYLRKGSLVLIEGRIKTRNWTNNQGIKQYRTEIITETMQLGPKGSGSMGNFGGGNSGYQRPSAQNRPEPQPEAKQDEIPIIEENYPLPASGNSTETISFEDDAAEEIDVKDIPF